MCRYLTIQMHIDKTTRSYVAWPAQLSGRTGTIERFIREWLANPAARGYITYDHNTGKYALPPKQALALADGNSPFFVPGGFQATTAFFKTSQRLLKPFVQVKMLIRVSITLVCTKGIERFFKLFLHNNNNN